jgi:hypothetical protein
LLCTDDSRALRSDCYETVAFEDPRTLTRSVHVTYSAVRASAGSPLRTPLGRSSIDAMTKSPTHRSFGEQARHYFTRPHTKPPIAPIVSPAAWRGNTMRKQEALWHARLDDDELAELDRGLNRLERDGVAIESVNRANFRLPRLAPKLDQWRSELMQGRGFVVVSGLPVDKWGDDRSALAFWALGHHLGVPGAQNPDGELLGHVKDYGEQTDSPNVRLYRTASDIRFHCDVADVVGLLCLHKARSGGQSRIASSVAIWNAIFEDDPDSAYLLFETFAHDLRGENRPDRPGHTEFQPCCFGADGVLRTFYHSEYFRSAARLPEVGPLPKRKQSLLDRYDALGASPDFHLDMWLEPGDMQFISNHTVVHARTEYEDAPDPARKRHLLRLWISLDSD